MRWIDAITRSVCKIFLDRGFRVFYTREGRGPNWRECLLAQQDPRYLIRNSLFPVKTLPDHLHKIIGVSDTCPSIFIFIRIFFSIVYWHLNVGKLRFMSGVLCGMNYSISNLLYKSLFFDIRKGLQIYIVISESWKILISEFLSRDFSICSIGKCISPSFESSTLVRKILQILWEWCEKVSIL